MTSSHREALAAFLDHADGRGWAALPFFSDGSASRLTDRLDAMAATGDVILPPAGDVFAAFSLGAPNNVKVAILGQDPYPTPGDAHGLAFSVNPGVRIPRSLTNIFRELSDDLGHPPPGHGDLRRWARQGVLLLNACLTVEAGRAGAHRMLGWEALTDQAIAAVAAGPPSVFILWGADAQRKRGLIDHARHCVIESPHPSPLSARRGFFGSRPFSRANAFLEAAGRGPIDWSLG